jgi:hypothetical protein
MNSNFDPRISTDFTRVTESMPDDDLRQRIVDFRASPDEIIDWFYRDDPLAETRSITAINFLAGNFTESKEYYENTIESVLGVRRTAEFEHAGITLLASVMRPESTQSTTTNWLNRYWTENEPELRLLPGQGNEKAAIHLLTTGQYKTPMPTEDMQKLLIALDCFSYASRSYSYMFQALNTTHAHPEDIKTSKEVSSKSDVYIHLSGLIAPLIMDQSQLETTGESPVEKSERTEAGMRAGLWHWFNLYDLSMSLMDSSAQNQANRDTHGLVLPLTFLEVSRLIRSHYLKESETDQRVIKGSKKGLLHEALWLMDMNFLLLHTGAAYSRAFPASLRIDKPTLNHPELNRGFDLQVIIPKPNTATPLRTMRVQLKSSKGKNHKGEYHPTIHLVEEENFMDTDKRRLTKKIDLYEAWATSSFDPSIGLQIKELLLGSSKAFMGVIEEVSSMSDLEYTLYKQPGITRNRAEMRRLARALGKSVRKH